jgi:hypothetical protein
MIEVKRCSILCSTLVYEGTVRICRNDRRLSMSANDLRTNARYGVCSEGCVLCFGGLVSGISTAWIVPYRRRCWRSTFQCMVFISFLSYNGFPLHKNGVNVVACDSEKEGDLLLIDFTSKSPQSPASLGTDWKRCFSIGSLNKRESGHCSSSTPSTCNYGYLAYYWAC